MIDTIVKPKNPIFYYKIVENIEKDSTQVAVGGQVEFKFQTTVKQPVKIQQHVQEES